MRNSHFSISNRRHIDPVVKWLDSLERSVSNMDTKRKLVDMMDDKGSAMIRIGMTGIVCVLPPRYVPPRGSIELDLTFKLQFQLSEVTRVRDTLIFDGREFFKDEFEKAVKGLELPKC